MGLDDDVYTALNTAWDITIIAKPTTWIYNARVPVIPKVRSQYIASAKQGTLEWESLTGGDDKKITQFKIEGFEASEANAILAIRATKKALHAASVTEGFWRIVSWALDEFQNLSHYSLFCQEEKYIDSNAW